MKEDGLLRHTIFWMMGPSGIIEKREISKLKMAIFLIADAHYSAQEISDTDLFKSLLNAEGESACETA